MKRRGFLKSLFAGTSAATLISAGGSRAVEAKTGDSNATVTAEIEALLRRTEAIWDSQDTARLRDLWDTEDPDPY